MDRILNRAEARIEATLRPNVREKQVQEMNEVEIASFPVAIMMTAASGNAQLQRRYALVEAKRASDLLKDESEEKVAEIAHKFNWKLRTGKFSTGAVTYGFALCFPHFLRNASSIQDEKWKLVNRQMLKGEVYVTKTEASRLLQEEIRRYIEEKLDTQVGILPPNVTQRVEKLKQLFTEMKGKIQAEEMPKEVVIDAFPPCIRELRSNALAGRHLSHIGRFALTSFLLSAGMPVEQVIECFRPVSDFSQKLTLYQVEHIAGARGSRTKYIPPKCDTLRTHGVCPGMDETCRSRVRHPLGYYRRKTRAIRSETPTTPPRE